MWASSTASATRHEGYGASLKQQCRNQYGTYIGFAGRGEMIPNENSYCDIDPDIVDQWGIPVLRFHWQWSDNEIKMAKDMQETFRSIVETAGGTFISKAKPDGPPSLRHRRWRRDHSRTGHRAHGKQSKDVGTEQILPGA